MALNPSEERDTVIGEVLTWVGVAVAALAAFGLYRSAERANARDAEDRDE
jgi:hypothetical protein